MTRPPEVVIIGGGILGCALAWRMAARATFPPDAILVVDPNPVASQATARAAALLSAARPASKAHWIALVRKTLALIDELAAEGCNVPLHRCGALHLADSSGARAVLADYERTASNHGLTCQRVTPDDWSGKLPWLDTGRFAETLWFPDEVYTDPYLLTSAYQAAARAHGVRFSLGKPTSLVKDPGGKSASVVLDDMTLHPAAIWVAAGAWSNVVLKPLGVSAAQAAVRSQYWITEKSCLATPDMPMVLAPDLRLYARPETGAILFGLREQDGVAARSSQLPDDLAGFVFDLSDSAGHATLESLASRLEDYAPGLMRTGLQHYITGPSCYTPDGDCLLGAVDGWDNVHLLSGCNGAGIALSGGLAELAADCVEGKNEPPATFNPARFGRIDADSEEWQRRCIAARAGKNSG